MKRLLLSFLTVAFSIATQAQWSVTALGVTNDTITFDATFSGVNNGAFAGDGLTSTPAAGQLDSDGWKFNGFSQGNTSFGGSYTSGDYAKGGSSGGVFSGGLYSFEVSPGDSALGVQPTASDWTPGDMILMVINNSGEDVDSIYLSYDLYINNNEARGNSFNFGWNINNSNSFNNVPALNETSLQASQGSVLWVAFNKETTINSTLNDGDTLYLAWSGADVNGSGSRDEFALDNIVVTLDTTAGSGASAALPIYDIQTISSIDANGVADSLGVECSIKGVTVGVDLDGNAGYSFTIWDGDGINVFSFVDVNGYQMDEGDSLQLFGTIGQFNGLIQFEVDSIAQLDSNQAIPTPIIITSLDESTESELVRIENFWVEGVSGLNYTLVNGSDTVVMRIDPDTDLPGNVEFDEGDTICYVVGIGGQFDNSNPYTDGYQFFPQRAADVDNSCGSIPPPVIPFYPIPDINNVDANGEPASQSTRQGAAQNPYTFPLDPKHFIKYDTHRFTDDLRRLVEPFLARKQAENELSIKFSLACAFATQLNCHVNELLVGIFELIKNAVEAMRGTLAPLRPRPSGGGLVPAGPGTPRAWAWCPAPPRAPCASSP